MIDRNKVETFILSFGWYAPTIFMLLQILQVIFAPIPGELTGIVGGYVFGTFFGFMYSTISLSIGSYLVFLGGQFLGNRYVNLIIPKDKMFKIKYLANKHGFITIFSCFLFPGFPKDYLCLFLGVINMPVKKFLLLNIIGRMPGTFFLSYQGSVILKKNYCIFLTFTIIMILIIYISFKYKNQIDNLLIRLISK